MSVATNAGSFHYAKIVIPNDGTLMFEDRSVFSISNDTLRFNGRIVSDSISTNLSTNIFIDKEGCHFGKYIGTFK